jgi:hypothetical protein
MALSTPSIEMVLDLVENRIDSLQVHDINDLRELKELEYTRRELRAMLGMRRNPHQSAQVIPLFPASA